MPMRPAAVLSSFDQSALNLCFLAEFDRLIQAEIIPTYAAGA